MPANQEHKQEQRRMQPNLQVYDESHKLGSHKPIKRQNCYQQNNLSKTPNLNEEAAAIYEDPRIVQDPLDAALSGLNSIHGPKTDYGVAAPGQILEVELFWRLPTAQDEF